MLEPTVSQMLEIATLKDAAVEPYSRLSAGSGVMQVLCYAAKLLLHAYRWGDTDLLLCNV